LIKPKREIQFVTLNIRIKIFEIASENIQERNNTHHDPCIIYLYRTCFGIFEILEADFI